MPGCGTPWSILRRRHGGSTTHENLTNNRKLTIDHHLGLLSMAMTTSRKTGAEVASRRSTCLRRLRMDHLHMGWHAHRERRPLSIHTFDGQFPTHQAAEVA